LVKKIKIQTYRDKMRFPTKKTTFSRNGGKLKPSPLQPVLPLLPEVLPMKDQDKAVLDSQQDPPPTKSLFVSSRWIDLIRDVEEIWMQISVNGPSDRTSMIRALLKGKSLTAINTALEDVWVDPNPNVQALVPLTLDHIADAMDQVTTAVFPHRALEIQKLWMNRGMRKPFDLSTHPPPTKSSCVSSRKACLSSGNVEEIWTQNSVNGPSDRTSTIRALLKGESLTAFDTTLEDVWVDPNPNVQALVPLTLDHICRNNMKTLDFWCW
jgi:hypothetical protein